MGIRCLTTLLLVLAATAALAAPERIATDRDWDRLPPPEVRGARATLAAAAEILRGWPIRLAGVEVTAELLTRLARTPDGEPLLRATREAIGRPVDLGDFLLLLDDLALAATDGLHGTPVFLPSGRARGAGILLHPDDVFEGEPRRYGQRPLAIYPPPRPAELEPAEDGAPLGPRWTARYRNPGDEEAMLAALDAAGGKDFADRIRSLLRQFRAQGAEAYVSSTVRSRERGYLIYGAFLMSRADTPQELRERAARLERLNREWGLNIPIRWRHPDGWQATAAAARKMAAAYNVVYATERGARYSIHYGAAAADFAAMNLPRNLTLTAPDGTRRRFDLSDPEHPRDLNLSPELIRWIEAHFGFRKLRSDYPHWADATGR
jgi:hypothetical protein